MKETIAVYPYKGICFHEQRLLFGMRRNTVARHLGEPDGTFYLNEENKQDFLERRNDLIFFYEQECLVSIDIPKTFQIKIKGLPLKGDPRLDLDLLAAFCPDLVFHDHVQAACIESLGLIYVWEEDLYPYTVASKAAFLRDAESWLLIEGTQQQKAAALFRKNVIPFVAKD